MVLRKGIVVSAQGSMQNRLVLLDGLRGLAAILVVLFHVELISGESGPFGRAYLVVDFFFLLSGFVLTLSAEPRMKAGLDPLGFMRGRVIRLWPVIAIGVAIGAVRHWGQHDDAALAAAIVMGLFMIPMLQADGLLFPLNGPHWSLLHELIANLAHGLVFRHFGNRALLAFCAVAALAVVVTVADFGSGSRGPFKDGWWLALPRIAFAYPMGIWLARQWSGREHHSLVSCRPLVSWKIALILPSSVVLALPLLPIGKVAGDLVTILLMFPAMLWIGATCQVPEQAGKWLARLGIVSFPLYAIHLPMLEMIAGLGNNPAIRFMAVVVTVACAYGIAMITERKALRKLGPAAAQRRLPA